MAQLPIFDGGNASNRGTNMLYPSSQAPAACVPPFSYADHQRAREYGVTKRIDLRQPSPFSGGGNDQALLCYLADKVIAVGDELLTHLLLPNTLLYGVSMGLVKAAPGFVFDVVLVNAATVPLNSVLFNDVAATTIPVNSTGCPLALYTPVSVAGAAAAAGGGFLIAEQSYLALRVVALPVSPQPALLATCGGTGLNMWVTAHVTDLDNGNA